MVFHLGNMWGEISPRAICLECFMVTDGTLTAAVAAAVHRRHTETIGAPALLTTTNCSRQAPCQKCN